MIPLTSLLWVILLVWYKIRYASLSVFIGLFLHDLSTKLLLKGWKVINFSR
jgi:hypothetical protein